MSELNDLNSISECTAVTLSRALAKESPRESRSNRFCATHAVSLTQRIQSLCATLQRQQERASVLLLGSISHHGVRPTYLPGELTRYRSLSGGATSQALSRRLQWAHQTFHLGRRQRETRLAHLPRFRSKCDSNSTTTLCSFGFGSRTGVDRLCLRRHHGRSLPVALPLGQVPPPQSGSQVTHLVGNSQRHPRFYCDYRRWRARGKPARRTATRAGGPSL